MPQVIATPASDLTTLIARLIELRKQVGNVEVVLQGHTLRFEIQVPLMKQLAEMANMEFAGINRMVLILDIDQAPTLYVESFLDVKKCQDVKLAKTDLDVKQGPVEFTDTTSVQNELYRTKVPKPQ